MFKLKVCTESILFLYKTLGYIQTKLKVCRESILFLYKTPGYIQTIKKNHTSDTDNKYMKTVQQF